MRNNTTSSKHINKQMGRDVYTQRRKVMDIIYKAKDITSLPRIDVRITDAKDNNVLGSAYIEGNSIFITERAINRKDLVTVVLHEILHAVYGQEHVQGCPLMRADVSGDLCTDTMAYKLFKQYVK